MAIKVVNAAKLNFLELVRTNVLGSATVFLFINNHIPTDADVFADYVEAGYQGYAEQTTSAWSPSAIVANQGLTQAATLVFLCTGPATPQDIYGYGVYLPGPNTLLWAELFQPGPLPMHNLGDTIIITPVLTSASEF